VIGNGIALGVYDLLIRNGVHYLLAAACAFPVAVGTNYTLNRHWTFRDRRGHVAAQGVRFVVVSLATLGANIGLLDLLIRVAGIDKLLAQAIAIVVLTPFNFLGNKLWSFGTPKLRAAG
jgi:putative flippase GtrA